MNTSIQIFNYNGSNITMKNEHGDVYVNLTEIAKAFPEKNLSQIVNSQEISEYVQELTEIRNYISADLLRVIKGGNPNEQGTWAHQKVALRVCQKLSTKFAIWVDEKIEELLTKGITATPATLDAIIADPDFGIKLLNSLKEERNRREIAERKSNDLEQKNASMLPKANFFDTVIEPANEYLDIGQTAKVLKLPYGRNTLFKVLREKGIFFKNKNEPKQEYIDRGYFKLYEKSIPRDNHPPLLVLTVLTSQRGIMFLSKTLGIASGREQLSKIHFQRS